MMTVTALARESGTTPHAVRYYTRLGLLTPQRNPKNGYRLYPANDLHWLRFIRQAKALGYTLHEIQEIKQARYKGHSPCPHVRAILQQRIIKNRLYLQELLDLQQRMEDALLKWSEIPDGSASDQLICPLIESIILPSEQTKAASGGLET